MVDEIGALELNNTWQIVDIPHTVKSIGCKQVDKIERLSDGNVECYKHNLWRMEDLSKDAYMAILLGVNGIHHPSIANIKNIYMATTKVLCYLKSCLSKELFSKQDFDVQILSFSDADWATCVDSYKSVTGYYFFLVNSLVSWKTKKQNTISHSSSKVKYRAFATATCELQ
ncbi:uncharacterized protein LOC113849578 [Abrus precatorius]|uniref:Uncharacterized protein LOC113849578 n=1 Tax=Abrus precatorius TaxID=3816 RepID=A0A8B8JVC6_ABRPR|nr:uncharacterized protein LOC113849578 [Abrus precatorius]